MKSLKLIVLTMLILVGLVSVSEAGAPCNQIDSSLVDTFTIVDTYGMPDSVVLMPIHISNRRNIAGFNVCIDLDTSIFTPIFLGLDSVWDSTHTVITDSLYYYDWVPGGRLDTSAVLPIVFDEPDYPNELSNRVRIIIFGLPKLPEAGQTTFDIGADTGRGDIVYVKFKVSPTAQHDDITPVYFYISDIVDPETFPPVTIGCRHSNYSDSMGLSIRPSTYGGRLIVDTALQVPPEIVSFIAGPSTISPGGSSTLSWEVNNADSIVISNGVGTFTNSTGNTTVYPSSTTTYVLTAYGGNQTRTAGTTVTVQDPGSNNNPIIASISPGSYVISEGENVAFSVSASDSDGDPITLSALNLPANASFGINGQVTGVGAASGNFSFTPNRGQAGVYNIQFQATDNMGGASNITTVPITVNEIENDIVFTISTADGSPVGGIPGNNSILFPIDFVTAQTVYGVQFDLNYDSDFIEIDSIITTPRTENFVVYNNIGESPGVVRILTFGMDNDTISVDSTGNTAILYVALTLDSTAPPGDYSIDITDGWESINPDPDYPSLALITDSGIVQVDRMGDVNLDQRVDVADVVNIVGYILGNYSFSPRQFDVADIITNATVNVFDLVGVINQIFGIPISPTAPLYIDGGFATVDLDFDPKNGNPDEIVVRSELPEMIAGVEMDINYDPNTILLGVPKLAADADGLTMSYRDNGQGNIKVLMHFTNPFSDAELIQIGAADLIKIPVRARAEVDEGVTQVRLSDIMLSTNTGSAVRVGNPGLPETFELHQNYPNPFNPTTTIQFAISNDQVGSLQHVTLDVYNILGQNVTSLIDKEMSTGHYEVVWDATNNQGRKVASGVYLYKLQVGDRRDTKKMLFIK